MSKPYIHAQSSAKKFGGVAEDYLPIHQLMDSSKEHIGDARHRALMHNTWGCFMIERVFGVVAKNSEGNEYSPRDVAEMHCIEDLGVIPTVADWLSKMPIVSDKELKEGSTSGSALKEYIEKGHEAKRRELLDLAKGLEAFLIAEFEKLPADKVNSIRWTQYTPGFNDGDPCEFSMGSTYASLDRDHDWSDDCDGGENGFELAISSSGGWNKENPFVPHNIPDDLYEIAFRDGVEVIWRRGATQLEVDSYDCGY